MSRKGCLFNGLLGVSDDRSGVRIYPVWLGVPIRGMAF